MSTEAETWVRVLLRLYRGDRFGARRSPEDDAVVARSDPLVSASSAPPTALDRTVLELERVGLVERRDDRFVSTERGFDRAQELALERQRSRREETREMQSRRLSRAGVYVSIGILLVGLFQFLASIYTQLGVPDVGLVLAGVIGGGVVLYLVVTAVTDELLQPTTNRDAPSEVVAPVGAGDPVSGASGEHSPEATEEKQCDENDGE